MLSQINFSFYSWVEPVGPVACRALKYKPRPVSSWKAAIETARGDLFITEMTWARRSGVCEKNSGFRFAGPSCLLPTLKRGVQGGSPGKTQAHLCTLNIRVCLDSQPTFFSQTPDRLTRVISRQTQ